MKRLFVVMVVLIVVGTMLFLGISCEQKTGESVEEEVSEDIEEEVAEITEEETGEPKTIVYYSLWNKEEPQAEVINGWIEDYKKIHPEITIEISFKGRDLLTLLRTALSAGEVVDLVDIDGDPARGSIIAEGETLIMDEFLDTPAYGKEKAWRDTFINGTLEQLAADDGGISLIPYAMYTNMFYYDKKLWGDNGWTVPKTWDEFTELCETIKTTSEVAAITQDCGIEEYNTYWFYQIIEKLKGPGFLLSAVEDTTGESWEDPAFKKAIEMERDLFDKGYFIEGCTGFIWPQGQNLLASREASMVLCGSWIPVELMGQVDEDWEWGAFPFPAIPGGVGGINDLEFYLIGWIPLKDTKVSNEIADFLKFCSSIENQEEYAISTLSLSAVKDVPVVPELEEVKNAISNVENQFRGHDGIAAKYPDYTLNVYWKNYNLAFLGDITPDEFISRMKKDTIEYWENK